MGPNKVFFFPFEKVERGSRVILYGFANVGRCFYNQVRKIGYCEILAIADKKANECTSMRYPTILPEQIPEYEYDYIVISVEATGTASQIRRELMTNLNIAEEKIVYAENYDVPIFQADTDLEQIMSSVAILERELYTFETGPSDDIQYFSNIIGEMRSVLIDGDTREVDRIKKYFVDYIESAKSVKRQFVVLRLLHAAGYFDGNLLEKYINNISKLKDYESRMWLMWDASVMERDEDSYRYRNFYLDKRRVMEENANYFGQQLSISTQEKGKHRSNRVAIIAMQLGDALNAHITLIVPWANEMQRQGKEVGVFAMDLLRFRHGECFVRPIYPLEQMSQDLSHVHKQIFEPGVKVFYNEGEDMQDRVINFMTKLREFSPDVVYDMCSEYSYLSPLIKKEFPMVAIPMRGYSSSACFDIYLCRNKEICIEENAKYPSMSCEQMEEIRISGIPKKPLKKFERKDYGIAEDAFVITTVGIRLKTELTREFVDCVCSFLDEHENACWILVGREICDYILQVYSEYLEQGRIIQWGYERDLPGFCYLCDIYWNPERMGAAGSITMAMRAGVPVVTTTYASDILARLRKENAIDGNYEDCKKYVEQLYADKNLYNEKSKLMLEVVETDDVSVCVEKLLSVGEELCQKWS